MIRVAVENELLVPVVVCDICFSQIVDVFNAAAGNGSMLTMAAGESYEVLHVHKGAA